MKKTIFSILTLAVVCMFVFSACKKDDKTFRVTTQKYNGTGDAKAYIENNYACWSDGDPVKINATTASVSLEITNSVYEATINGIPRTDDGYYALYPASYCEGSFTNGSVIELPSVINYVESQGKQVIYAPMAAKADADDVLKFTNLCTLLKVHVNSAANIIREIKLIADPGTVKLCGQAPVSFDANGVPTLGSITGGGNTITLNCGSGVNLSGGKDFYIPVPSLAKDTKITIRITDKFGQEVNDDVTVTNTTGIPANIIVGLEGPHVLDNDAYDFYDYIWSQESGYIDLGIKPDNTSKMELTYAITIGAGTNECSHYLTGSRDNNDFLYFSMGGSVNRTDFQCSFMGNPTINEAYNREIGVKYRNTMEVQKTDASSYRGKVTYEKLDASNNPVIVNTLYSASHESGITSGAGNIYVFALKAGQLHKGMKLYGYRVWKDEDNDGESELVADFVPVKRKSDNHVGVYNMATGTFIEPTHVAGKPEFTVGND